MKRLLTAFAVLVVPAPALAQDQAPGGMEDRSTLSAERHLLTAGTFSLATGYDFSTGRFGTPDSTDVLYIPVTGKYESDKLTLKLTVPYLEVTGPGGVIYGVGPLGQTTQTTMVTTDSGMGDVIASVGYTVYENEPLTLDLVGKIKFGTANTAKGLGTGKTDYAGQLDADYTLGKTTIFGTVGYKVYGSPVDGDTLRNVPYGTIGASHKLGDTLRAGAMLYVKQSPTIFSGHQREVTVFVSRKVMPDTKLEINASRGYATGSPDWGFGTMITHYF